MKSTLPVQANSCESAEPPSPSQQLRTEQSHVEQLPCSGSVTTVPAGGKQQREAGSAGLRVYGLVTWNVAGWRSTLLNIQKDWGSLETFLKCLECDILCLQVSRRQ